MYSSSFFSVWCSLRTLPSRQCLGWYMFVNMPNSICFSIGRWEDGGNSTRAQSSTTRGVRLVGHLSLVCQLPAETRWAKLDTYYTDGRSEILPHLPARLGDVLELGCATGEH